MTDFLRQNRHIWAYGLVFTKTKHNGYWQQYFPNHCIINKWDEGLIRKWLKIQESRVTQDGVNNRILFLLDDMASDPDFYYSKLTSELAFNGRHFQADVVYATQQFVKSTTAMRQNCDLMCCLTTTNINVLKQIYEEFGSVEWRSFYDFAACLLKYTEQYGAFIINNNDPNKRGKDRFQTYTASPEVPDFTMFCEQAWVTPEAGSRTEVKRRQRKDHKPTNAYSANYLKQLKSKPESDITIAQFTGQTQQSQQAQNKDPFSTLLRR